MPISKPSLETRFANPRSATRLAFFEGGFAMGCVAPLYPFLKDNVGADEALFGLLLLCFGIGSIVAMPVTGLIAARLGAKLPILLGGLGLAIFLPLAAICYNSYHLAACLLILGASAGTIDVAMNIHAAQVEAKEKRVLMSNFHALFSIGTLLGAGFMTLMLYIKLTPQQAIFLGAIIMMLAIVFCMKGLLNEGVDEPEPYTFPKGIVILLAILTAILFLVEGALLDWGALLLLEKNFVTKEFAGIGFILFSVTMVIGRLTGDRTIEKFGNFQILLAGNILTLIGLVLILCASSEIAAFAGFAIVGLGAANIVPILFRATGKQKIMPPGLAMTSVVTTGYAGILLGPAVIGFVADFTSISIAFWALVVLILISTISSRIVTRL